MTMTSTTTSTGTRSTSEGTVSDPLLEQQPLLRPASGQSDAGAFMRNSVAQSEDAVSSRSSIPGSPGPAFPADRPRTKAGFSTYMGQRAEGADRTRLQELRKKHG